MMGDMTATSDIPRRPRETDPVRAFAQRLKAVENELAAVRKSAGARAWSSAQPGAVLAGETAGGLEALQTRVTTLEGYVAELQAAQGAQDTLNIDFEARLSALEATP